MEESHTRFPSSPGSQTPKGSVRALVSRQIDKGLKQMQVRSEHMGGFYERVSVEERVQEMRVCHVNFAVLVNQPAVESHQFLTVRYKFILLLLTMAWHQIERSFLWFATLI